MNHEDYGSLLTTRGCPDQFPKMSNTSGRGGVGETGCAILYQRDGLDFHPAHILRPAQAEVKPALSNSHLRLNVIVLSKGFQPPDLQGLGGQRARQPCIHRDQHLPVGDQPQVEASLAFGLVRSGEVAPPARDKQFGEPTGVGQVSSGETTLNLDCDSKSVVASKKAALGQRRDSHAVDYTMDA